MSIRALDLFSGAGGSSWGAREAGVTIVAAFDLWKLAGDSHRVNFPEAAFVNGKLEDLDIATLTKSHGKIDLILASPECTNHSPAKGNKPRCEESKDTAFQVKQDIARQLVEIIPTCVEEPDTAEAEVCGTFAEATRKLKWESFDVLVLDLKDDSEQSADEDENPAGVKVFDELKKTRFVPVVFYTALPKKVPAEETSFIRIVEKTQAVTKVRDEIQQVLATKLPGLTKQIEEFHRSYMWDFVTAHWQSFPPPRDQSDIAYLLARRLAISLERHAVKLAGSVVGGAEETALAHPMMHYLTPPLGTHRMAGDLLREKKGDTETFWIVLTPSCDFAQNKAHHVVVAKCERLTDVDEYKAWIKDHPKDPSKTALDAITSLIGNNRKGQAERYKFLPGTFFLPDLVVDFQQLRSFSKDAAYALEAVASLDSPYAEALLASFARYFGRLGTPDLDKALVLGRLRSALPAVEAGK